MRPDGSAVRFDPLLSYMMAHPTRSSTWQDQTARAVGLLWDFKIQVGDAILARAVRENRNPQNLLLQEFAFSLLHGTTQVFPDVTGLYWPANSKARVEEFIKSIEVLSDWMLSESQGETERRQMPALDTMKSNPLILADYLIWSRIRRISMLQHLNKQPKHRDKHSVVELGRPSPVHKDEPVNFFPPSHAEKLLWDGHRRKNNVDPANPFFDYNLRDQMIVLLDGWGGLRRSDGLHLWCQDVVEEPGKPGSALVVINHPSEATVEYVEHVTRKLKHGSRTVALQEMYGILPRNTVTRGAYHAGFKGMDLNRQKQAFVYWLDEGAAQLFWTLYHGYLRYVRQPIMARRMALGGYNHPFLFVSEKPDSSGLPGAPYSERAQENNHNAAVRRIGLPLSKADGTTTHGLRHLYGHTLMKWGVPAQIIQKGLHHRHFLSQVPYTIPDRKSVSDALTSARKRSLGEAPEVPALGHESSRELLKLQRIIIGKSVNDQI
ncbi:hypothetical protein [Tianweitania sp.]|uniref:hypothetical protein n=1 Tax=Tianweitania sp. TaxID=2021634 RepID=UPI00289A2844|nr:hypothetical protein [Tianweitania sp.]